MYSLSNAAALKINLFSLWNRDSAEELAVWRKHTRSFVEVYSSWMFTIFFPVAAFAPIVLIPHLPAEVYANCAIFNLAVAIIYGTVSVFSSRLTNQGHMNSKKLKLNFMLSTLQQILIMVLCIYPIFLLKEHTNIEKQLQNITGIYTAIVILIMFLRTRFISILTIFTPFIFLSLHAKTNLFLQADFADLARAFITIFLVGMIVLRVETAMLRALYREFGYKRLLQAENRARKRADKASKSLTYFAFHDPLTNLHNRRAFMEELERRQAECLAEGTSMGLLLIDLDRFKEINDTLGHAAGDQLLKQTADRIFSIVKPDDFVARLGGDEFIILTSGDKARNELDSLAEALLIDLAKPISFNGSSVGSDASIGFATFPEDGRNGEELLRCADLALYSAKAHGGHCAKPFHVDLLAPVQAIQSLQVDLVTGLSDRSIHMQFQPQVDFTSGKVIGFEALIRWNHPTRGWIPPNLILEAANQANLSMIVFAMVVNESCKLIRRLDELGYKDIVIAINISSSEIHRLPVAEIVAEGLARNLIDPRRLEVEITEQITFSEEETRAKLATIQALGVQLAIDDFGVGYSSLSSLMACKFDRLKIDRMFVTGINEDKRSQTLVKMINAVGRGLHVNVLAEGVETEAQAQRLKSMGINHMQGYFFGKSMTAEALEVWLAGKDANEGQERQVSAA